MSDLKKKVTEAMSRAGAPRSLVHVVEDVFDKHDDKHDDRADDKPERAVHAEQDHARAPKRK
jgi:hypothetical protein